MLPPPNRFPSVLQPLSLALVVKLVLNNTFLRTHAPFRSFTFLLSLGTEFTEYKCQSVCACACACADTDMGRQSGDMSVIPTSVEHTVHECPHASRLLRLDHASKKSNSDGLHPNSDGLQPSSDGLHPRFEASLPLDHCSISDSGVGLENSRPSPASVHPPRVCPFQGP